MSSLVVLGGSGVVGRSIVRLASSPLFRPHFERVCAVSRSIPSDAPSNVQHVSADLLASPLDDSLKSTLAAASHVVHCIGALLPCSSYKRIIKPSSYNATSDDKELDLMALHVRSLQNILPHLSHSASLAYLSANDNLVGLADPLLRFLSPTYFPSKRAAETLLIQNKANLKQTIIVRPGSFLI